MVFFDFSLMGYDPKVSLPLALIAIYIAVNEKGLWLWGWVKKWFCKLQFKKKNYLQLVKFYQEKVVMIFHILIYNFFFQK